MAELQNQPKTKSGGSTGPCLLWLNLNSKSWAMLRLPQAHVVPFHTLTLIALKASKTNTKPTAFLVPAKQPRTNQYMVQGSWTTRDFSLRLILPSQKQTLYKSGFIAMYSRLKGSVCPLAIIYLLFQGYRANFSGHGMYTACHVLHPLPKLLLQHLKRTYWILLSAKLQFKLKSWFSQTSVLNKL